MALFACSGYARKKDVVKAAEKLHSADFNYTGNNKSKPVSVDPKISALFSRIYGVLWVEELARSLSLSLSHYQPRENWFATMMRVRRAK